MSEKILRALTQLFGLITKQDGGATQVERDFVVEYFKKELDPDSVNIYTSLYDEISEFGITQEAKPISMKESVRILKFCRQINSNLEQRQKVIILVKLLELVASDKNFTAQRRQIIDTVSQAFHIEDDYGAIENFVMSEDSSKIDDPDVLVASASASLISPDVKHYVVAGLSGEIIFKRVKSVDLYFVKYVGNDEVRFNNFVMKRNQVTLFSNGSSVKTPQGVALYYGDIVSIFLENLQDVKLSFTVRNLQFRFPNGAIGIQNVSISENQGKLLGIMGGSGAGKTTLLNVLAGIESPSSGAVEINGINIHKDKDKIEGVIGL
ncbi:MAG: ATP-binding cassette domain-containing protein, partial [Microscillaceae bacterium]|nr:ATP-binding cassette domain-containing protein [Microscillaceae bacterium]